LPDEGEASGERRLGAIMFTDVVGYSSISSLDEGRALKMLEGHRKLMQAVFPKYGGRVVKTTGDGFLVEFASAVQAVNCAVDAQREMAAFNAKKKQDEKVLVRIGVHVGDIVHSGGDVLGDAVNVAARLEQVAEPGGICLSRQVVDQVERKVVYRMVGMGVRELKNINYPVEVYRVEVHSGTPQGGRVFDPRRVAILPFANMSPDPNDRYFADGMTEELISTVSRIGELQVISRTSVMRYREGTVPVSQIGQELSVGSVLEGSVRKAGNRVRITAQLVEVQGDRHLWAESYDRDLTDIFAIQGDIAERIAGSLRVQLVAGEKQSIRKEATSNPDAHTLYLKGRFYWNERTEEGTKKALKYFEEAAKVDPKFAMAYSGMADAYNILSDYNWMAPSEALPLAKLNATKALEIDDSLAEAHASLGLTLSNYTWDFASAEKEFARAIEIKHNYAPAHHWYALMLFYMRRYAEARTEEERALQLDPYSRVYNMAMTNGLLVEGKLDDAIRRYDELIAEYPDFAALRFWRFVAHTMAGQFDKAIDEAKKNVEMNRGSLASKLGLAWVYAEAGSAGEAEKLVSEAIAGRDGSFASPVDIAWVKLALGQKDEGYAWLQRAYQERDPRLLYFNAAPEAKKFRADPRWAAIEAKLGFVSAPD
jgi:TolB-like protein/Tfp pilus assembly protein PilF